MKLIFAVLFWKYCGIWQSSSLWMDLIPCLVGWVNNEIHIKKIVIFSENVAFWKMNVAISDNLYFSGCSWNIFLQHFFPCSQLFPWLPIDGVGCHTFKDVRTVIKFFSAAAAAGFTFPCVISDFCLPVQRSDRQMWKKEPWSPRKETEQWDGRGQSTLACWLSGSTHRSRSAPTASVKVQVSITTNVLLSFIDFHWWITLYIYIYIPVLYFFTLDNRKTFKDFNQHTTV